MSANRRDTTFDRERELIGPWDTAPAGQVLNVYRDLTGLTLGDFPALAWDDDPEPASPRPLTLERAGVYLTAATALLLGTGWALSRRRHR